MQNKLNICKIMILPAAALLLASCGSSQRLPFVITAQYADRPVLIGQYKRPGEKIDIAAAGTSFESKQGTAYFTRLNRDFNINKLSRDILILNPKKTDMLIIQEIKVESYTWDTSGDSFSNESTVKGKITGNQ